MSQPSPVVLVTEQFERELIIHAVMQIPLNVSTEQAQRDVAAAREEAIKQDPDEWSYDQVVSLLTDKGYVWVEFCEACE